MIKDLEQKIALIRENYIDELLVILKKCPDANEYEKSYPELKGYLIELSKKDCGVLGGLIIALECYLDK